MRSLPLLALAAIGVAGLAQAQTVTTSPQPAEQMQPVEQMPSGSAYGGQMPPAGPATGTAPSEAMVPTGPDGTFKDEYGFRYNSRGDRIDSRGRVLPPPVTPPGARTVR